MDIFVFQVNESTLCHIDHENRQQYTKFAWIILYANLEADDFNSAVIETIATKLQLKAPSYVELSSIKDFGRLVCALERTPLPAFSLTLDNEHIFAVQADFVNGRPVIYFAKSPDPKKGQYLAYRISNGIEEVLIIDSVTNPTFVYAPLINVDKFPTSLSKKGRAPKRSEYVVIKLKDLASLAKVAAYKTIYDEPPLPLFLYKEGSSDKFVIGAAMSLTENDTIAYFYYVSVDEEPKDPFLRYSSQKVEPPLFSARLDEHGYIYLKVVKLASPHPLVKTYD